jgi:hypothetical protein
MRLPISSSPFTVASSSQFRFLACLTPAAHHNRRVNPEGVLLSELRSVTSRLEWDVGVMLDDGRSETERGTELGHSAGVMTSRHCPGEAHRGHTGPQRSRVKSGLSDRRDFGCL